MSDEGEALERAEMVAIHEAAGPELAERLHLSCRAEAGGLVSIAGALPPSAIVVNRAFGFAPGSLSPETVRALAAEFAERGVSRFFLQAEGAEAAARAAGLEPARGWQKFARGAEEPLPEAVPGLVVRELGRDGDVVDAVAFARIVTAAFDLGEAAVPWIARLPAAAGLRLFLAEMDGEPAGTGGVFIRGALGWTNFGATAPAFRRRGIQASLLAHRVRVALAAGCRRIHTCTGEAVPGDPQHSWNNIVRCGFRPTSLRPNWAPARA